MQYSKVDNKLAATRDIYNENGDIVRTDTTTYTLEYLNAQEAAITAQRDELMALKEQELALVNNLKQKALELGVTE